jgi:hypothetical protein
MAVLGHRGRLWLRREAPDPVVLQPSAVHAYSNGLVVRSEAFWTGDEVTLTASSGLPIVTTGGAVACPDGHGVFFGSDWLLGANRAHITAEDDLFYVDEPDEDVPFYLREEDVGLLDSASFFIYRDRMDRISFYADQEAAMRGDRSQRVALGRVDFGSMILGPWGSADYQNALVLCGGDIGDYEFSDIQDEVTLASICDSAPGYQAPVAGTEDYDNADVQPRSSINRPPDRNIWTVQGDLSEWSLSLTSQEVDTTALGERYGESIKALITGGGTLDFIVTRRSGTDRSGAPRPDSTQLMRLLLMAERGCTADAQFWMIDDQPDVGELLPGDLFYDTRMMITSMAINTRATDYIAGSVNFVTVGQIDLRVGSN